MKSAISALCLCACLGATAQTIVGTSAYQWVGDTIIQGEYKAYAPSATHIVSNYKAQPHYYMGTENEWRLHNDISMYPQLSTPNTLLNAVYNMSLDEMVNAVEPDTTLRTGKEWAGVWTRDVSYSIILSMAYMQPEASKISLMKKVDSKGRIIQDTGSGGAWPVSTDRMVWAIAAMELYKVTGDKEWLHYAYPIIKRSMDDDLNVVFTNYGQNRQQPDAMQQPGLVRGETSFIDWREQSYPRWMQCADIYESQSMSTNMVHAIALDVLSQMADMLGQSTDAKRYGDLAKRLGENIDAAFWMEDKGYNGMYLYGRDYMLLNPRAETLGESLGILYDVTPLAKQRRTTESNPTTPYGVAIFYPQIADMPAYHNNGLWPWVGCMWALANAKVQNEEGTLQAIGAIVRPAALFCTNKENFNLDNGDIATELNSSNMLWCLSGNLALTYRILFGIHFELDGLHFIPFVPKALAEARSLSNFPYREAMLDIAISGSGSEIASFKVDGVEQAPIISPDLKGSHSIEIVMADNEVPAMAVNNQPNLKAPLTPISMLSHSVELAGQGVPVNNLLSWQPIEYINHYIVLLDGKEVAQTTSTEYPAVVPGMYQVIGVVDDGTQSFASVPLSNQPLWIYEMPNERNSLVSKEVSYQPKDGEVRGYHSKGFVELDHSTPNLVVPIEVPVDGQYAIELVYANGNGPVNTENKCAIRTITVDGKAIGTVVMPQRGVGNWSEWGLTNAVQARLKAGKHQLGVTMFPNNENMNIATNHAIVDRVRVSQLK